jgi:hypothetical protein
MRRGYFSARGIRPTENEIYDDLVSRLLRNRLHLAESNAIVIARLGTRDRKKALTAAIGRAQMNFAAKFGARNFGQCDVATEYPHQSGGLQAADYFLWALHGSTSVGRTATLCRWRSIIESSWISMIRSENRMASGTAIRIR